jgi:site-specific DNA recombinase
VDGCLEGESPENVRDPKAGGRSANTITVPYTATAPAEVRGILHSPSPRPTMSLESRDVLLAAIAKARSWIDDLMEGRAASFAEIANREGRVERHIRFLALPFPPASSQRSSMASCQLTSR